MLIKEALLGKYSQYEGGRVGMVQNYYWSAGSSSYKSSSIGSVKTTKNAQLNPSTLNSDKISKSYK